MAQLTAKVNAEMRSLGASRGLTDVSRSALYTRLEPKNHRTRQGKRHVNTVPVRENPNNKERDEGEKK